MKQSANEFGLIYGLTNPYLKGMVKIGLTHNLDISKRISVLNTSVPAPFECAFAYKVPHSDLHRIEHILHDNYCDKRLGGSEFFAVEPSKVDALLSALGKFEPMKTAVQDSIDIEVAKQKAPAMDFFRMGFQQGDILVFKNDSAITCTIATNRKVLYQGQQQSLSNLTKTLLSRKYAPQPSPYWQTAAGESLLDVYNDFVKKNAEALSLLQSNIDKLCKNA